ncbi:MAG TPA: hypothetical protein VFG42_04995 [Baekduia sp.]|uniref:hypothetical protein n=1 Tax=Baekduia sp. TaxID=2600305 RepID=UPI002D7810DC|nr:hypothetical protein [Baekduia sp.]HET6506122.1 hypothetical protein [Baekduia sp.]
MKNPLVRLAAAALSAAGVAALTAGPALAGTPSFDRCPRAQATVAGCAEITSTDGAITANDHTLPLGGAGLDVQGGLTDVGAWVPSTSRPTLTARPVDVPGGLLGRDLPSRLNTVKATIEPVGPIDYDVYSYKLTLPVRIHFTNPLLGPNCAIGSAAAPITLSLAVTTPGTFTSPPNADFGLEGQVQGDAGFAVPAATGCGVVAQTSVTKIINRNLGLPSAAGNNRAQLTLNHYVGA